MISPFSHLLSLTPSLSSLQVRFVRLCDPPVRCESEGYESNKVCLGADEPPSAGEQDDSADGTDGNQPGDV